MTFVLRALRLICIVVWVGGLIFFAFVEAPMAFHVMGTTREFAQLINGSIRILNELGHLSGLVFFIATLLLLRHVAPRSRRLMLYQVFLIVAMILATMYVQHVIIPAMERDRSAAGGDIASLSATNPVRANFDHLHTLSEKVEGAALFLGIGVVFLMAAEAAGSRRTSSFGQSEPVRIIET